MGEERRKKRKEQVELIKQEYEANENITVFSKWKQVVEEVKEHEAFKWLSKLEALTSWEEWTTDKAKQDLDAKRKEKFRRERTARDAFRDLLGTLHYDGKITNTTH